MVFIHRQRGKTMNPNTAITTAARRIARELNVRPKEITIGFDGTGHVTEAWPTGTWTPGQGDGAAVIHRGTRTGDRMTYRAAQDLLDAAAWVDTHPQDVGPTDPIGDFLDLLNAARIAQAAA
jgi:pectin methylesterase-like acyl-CoA thioesterase